MSDTAVFQQTPPGEHDGGYVLTTDGSRDFGEIPKEVAREINRPSGEIRLRIGKHEDGPDNYGQQHIEREDRFKQLKDNGYQNARDLVEDVARNYSAIYPGKFAPLMLVKKGHEKSPLVCVEITEDEDGNFYDVKTGFIARNNYIKNKTPLWVKPMSGIDFCLNQWRRTTHNEKRPLALSRAIQILQLYINPTKIQAVPIQTWADTPRIPFQPLTVCPCGAGEHRVCRLW